MFPSPSVPQHKRRFSSVDSVERSLVSAHSGMIPQLPEITGDIVLETFAHKSLKLLRNDGEPFDNGRLSELGKCVLQLAAANYLYNKPDALKLSNIDVRAYRISAAKIHVTWVE